MSKVELGPEEKKLFNDMDNKRRKYKLLANVLWILIIVIGLIGSYMFFHFMQEMQYYSDMYSTAMDGKMTNKFGKVIYESKGVEVIINEKGETIENVREWSKKNYFKNLYIGIIMIVLTVVIIFFLVRTIKRLIKEKVHLEFKLEKLKYEGLKAAEEFERKHPVI